MNNGSVTKQMPFHIQVTSYGMEGRDGNVQATGQIKHCAHLIQHRILSC